MLTTIKVFRHGEHRYRHAMNFHNDEVLLQRLNLGANRPESEWETLLSYDRDAVAWEMSGKQIGLFVTSGGHWLFRPTKVLKDWPIINCESTRSVESLLDSEVTISKRWLESQQ